ncbi:MAG: heat shock protein HtpX [Actinomycetota bacterium]|nr:heat shock protein HtpX [Actinomycetota bacterium]
MPGPVDRESFDRAQRRHRRASWRWTLACAGAIALIGIPLSAALSPLLVAVVVFLNDVVNLVVHTPDLLSPFRDAIQADQVADVPRLVVSLVIVLVVPGAVAITGCWLAVRRLFRHAGTGAELLAMGAREPSVDQEEHQLVNVVAEIALAGGLPPPRVYVVDSPVANAAVTGSSPADAAIVVSRGLLDGLGRAETQGVIAHLVGRVGNGDLAIARTIASLYYTLGLCSTVLTAPTDRRARRSVGPILRLLVRPSSAVRHPERARDAALALLEAQGGGGDETIEAKGCLSVLLLPLMAAQLAFVMNQMLFSMLLVNPLLKRAWRARSALADATAVELTRYPDGLAAGLIALADGGVIPGTESVAHLFVIGPHGSGAGDTGHTSPLAGFQPKMDRRISRLRALGATVELDQGPRRMGLGAKLLLVLIGGPLVVVFYALMLGISVAITGVAFALYMMFLVGPVFVIDSLLRGGGG